MTKIDIKEIQVLSEKETLVTFELETERRLVEGFITIKNGIPIDVNLLGGGALTNSDEIKIKVAARKAIQN